MMMNSFRDDYKRYRLETPYQLVPGVYKELCEHGYCETRKRLNCAIPHYSLFCSLFLDHIASHRAKGMRGLLGLLGREQLW